LRNNIPHQWEKQSKELDDDKWVYNPCVNLVFIEGFLESINSSCHDEIGPKKLLAERQLNGEFNFTVATE
jgi:hypothetical protein